MKGLAPSFALLGLSLAFAGAAGASDPAGPPSAPADLAQAFQTPPESAKPKTWWHWMSGCVSREGITADLESMKRVGLGGAFIFNVGQLPVEGPVKFESEEWWSLMRFAAEESGRLGLELGFHNCPGWSSSGGPWIPVDKSMQKVVWSEQDFAGPGAFRAVLAEPKVDPRWNFYRDIAVLAVPDGPGPVKEDAILDLTAKLSAAGELAWEAPPGKWAILRFGRTTTGSMNEPAPPGAEGLECDKLDREGVDAHFDGYVAKVLANAGAATGRSLREVFIDSYEVGNQTWSPSFRAEFMRRRGYDPVPWLVTETKRTVGSDDLTERFGRDWKQTISDLFADNYYGYITERTHRYSGVRLACEPYTGPFDTVTCGTRVDEVAAEFWASPSKWGWPTLKPVASSAHLTGKRLVCAEAFTGQPQYAQFRQDPYALKAAGDRAFTLGINQFILHTSAHQPWEGVKPGVTMGPWGTHFGRNQTWWDESPAWFAYLTRCQELLQAGQFVADVCFLEDENGSAPGYDGDSCNEETLVQSMAVRDGRLTLPCGMSYRVLALPASTRMTPAVARKLRALVEAGAVVVGPKPVASPSLEGYPACDEEVRRIAGELWDTGKVKSGVPVAQVLGGLGVVPDFGANAADILWIHRRIGEADVYFVSNQEPNFRIVSCSFRVLGREPELWDAATGRIRDARTFSVGQGRTVLPIKFDPSGSVFVVFRRPAGASNGGDNWDNYAPAGDIVGPWDVSFDPKWGGPRSAVFPSLGDWTKRGEPGIRYYSGTATYTKEFDWSPRAGRIFLDLGSVKNLAEVSVNGTRLGVLWKPPFLVEVTGALRPGQNALEVRVTNLWPNRMIGDEQEPDDCAWGAEDVWTGIGATPTEKVPIGHSLKEIPAWLTAGTPRPSGGRYTFTTWKFYTKDSPLMESGLLGPVRLMALSN
ncbi:MAG: glycosyl hydrolase [Opitutaceae bacterium]